MNYTFDYFYTMLPTMQFDVEEISNFTVNLQDQSGVEWYIDVKTELGDTEIRYYGPLVADIGFMSLPEFKFEYCKIPYVEKNIIKRIDNYLNKQGKFIVTNVEVIEREEFYRRLREVMNYGDGFDN